jgi:hypothetical protein
MKYEKEVGLGEEKEWNKYKIYYLIFMIFVVAFLAFSWIGQTSPYKKQMVMFYSWLAFISLAFILFDLATLHHFKEIDSILIERTPIHPKYIFMIGLIFALLLGVRIYTTNSAWVGYPKFQFFDSKYANSFLSAIVGVVENWFFFAFLTPTIFVNLNKHVFRQNIMAGIITIFLSSFIFMIYHIFVYATSQLALLSVFLFGLICTSSTLILRTVILADFLHFTNNFIASLIQAGVAIVWM